MKIDVKRANAEKRYAGELEEEFEGDNALIDIPFVEFSSPVKVRVAYEIQEDGVILLSANLSFEIKGLCSRCLKETRRLIESEFEGRASAEDNGEDYFYKNGTVDLGEFLRDGVLCSLPYTLQCEEECAPPEYKE